MKKLLVLVLVLGMASLANATLKISVNGIEDPPETQIVLQYSEHADIDVTALSHPANTAYGLFCDGYGQLTVDDDTVLYYQGSLAMISNLTGSDLADWQAFLADMGYANVTSVVYIELFDGVDPMPIEDGDLVDYVDFHCTQGDPENDVLLGLIEVSPETYEVIDTQIIHQVPEPMTVALLGLGGLFLLRRRR